MRFSRTDNHIISMDGGINTESVEIDVPPNMFIAGYNHELADPKGYQRILGFERFDGQDLPSESNYTVISGDHVNDAAEGDVLTGATSGVSVKLLADYTDTMIGFVYGTLIDGETLRLGGTDIISNITGSLGFGLDTIDDDEEYKILAVEEQRLRINEVPGTGILYGVTGMRGTVYAFMGTDVYKSTSTGWVSVQLPVHLAFDAGNGTAFPVGSTITGATSGATGALLAIQTMGGAWSETSGGTAAGHLILENVTGTFQNNEQISDGTSTADADGDSEQVTRTANDSVYIRSTVSNFTGNVDDMAIYGADGVNNAFKIDKNGKYIPIYTGAESSGYAPKHILMHHHHLFLSYYSSWMISGIGDPFSDWSTISGGDEWGMGDEIVGGAITPNGTMVSFCNNRIDVVYGSTNGGIDPFTIKPYTDRYGALENSIQVSIAPTFVNSTGLTLMTTTQKWGDFEINDIDATIKTLIDAIKADITASCIFHTKNEYRVYSHNSCVRMKIDSGKIRGFTVDSYQHPIKQMFMMPNATEDEVYFVSDTNFVYRMDSGNSFDGEKVTAFMILAPDHLGKPRRKKKWYDTTIEAESVAGRTSFLVNNDYSLFRPGIASRADISIDIDALVGRWDLSKWDQAVFGDSATDTYYKVRDHATGAAVTTMIFSENTHNAPYTIKLINRRYAWRGEIR